MASRLSSNESVCPLCDSADSRLVESTSTGQLIRAWNDGLQIDVTDELSGVDEIHLFACRRCHLQFFMPRNVAGSARLYEQLEKLDWYYMPRKWEYDVAARHLHSDMKALEIGCGTGTFVARARQLGVDMEGIELNPSAVAQANEAGLPVHLQDLSDTAAQRSGDYDAVCSFQVLEHVTDPKRFLADCCNLLKPGGKLLLAVPNSDSFIQDSFNFLDKPPHHTTRWNRNVFATLPDLFPLRLEETRLEPLAKYHVQQWLHARAIVHEHHPLLRQVFRVELRNWLAKCLVYTGVRKFLTGMTLFAQFVRV